MGSLKISTKLIIGFGIVVFLMITVSTIAHNSITSLIKSEKWVEHTHEVIETADAVAASMVDMETGKRGFLVTGIEEYLEPYNNGLKNFDKYILEGATLTSDNPTQVNRWNKVKELKVKWISESAEPEMKLRREVSKGDKTIKKFKIIASRTLGKELFDGIRAKLAILEKKAGNDATSQAIITSTTLALVNMETGQRGFLLSGKEASLEPYIDGGKSLIKELKKLKRISSSTNITHNDINLVVNAVNEWKKRVANVEINARRDMNNYKFTIDDISSSMANGKGKFYMDSIRAIITEIINAERILLVDRIKKADETASFATNFTLFGTLIAAIVALIIASLNIKNIQSSLKRLNKAIEELTDSQDISARIKIETKDEVGEVSSSFNNYLQSLENGIAEDKKVIEETRVVIEKVNAGLYNERIIQKANSVEVEKLINVINKMIDTTQLNLTLLGDGLKNLSLAKYDEPIMRADNTTGLIASLFQGTQITQSTINEVMALIDNSTVRLTYSADDLSVSANELSESSNQQAVALEETAGAIEEVTSKLVSSTENTVKMSEYARNVTKSSETGIELANKTSVSMDELSNEITTINDAIKVIDQIAFQTNILSLNAAVEAATAGEAGKGFAVVAQEVRNLASRSAEAANEIKELVESANAKANDGKNVASQMIEGFNELNKNISTTITIIKDVANSTKEQQDAMSQINTTVNSLDHATQHNASLSSKISEMAADTKELAVGLQGAVNKTTFSKEAKRRVCDTSMIFDLNKLKSDHIHLKDDSLCLCKVGNKVNVKSHTECDMGKWIIANENSDFAQTELWQELTTSHKSYHEMIQDTVDLYKDNYENGQIFSVTENMEKQIDKIYLYLDRVKEHNCNLQFERKED